MDSKNNLLKFEREAHGTTGVSINACRTAHPSDVSNPLRCTGKPPVFTEKQQAAAWC